MTVETTPNETFDNERLSSARATLLKYYTDQQNSQATRLIGFGVGLFTLLQLTQSYTNSRLHIAFSYFPPIILFGEVPIIWDFLKGIFLYLATAFVLYFILRSIFRFSVFGSMAEQAISLSKSNIEKYLGSYLRHCIEEENVIELSCLHVAIIRYVYTNSKILGFQASNFISVDEKAEGYPSRTNRGIIILAAFALFFAFLLLLFLW